MHAIPGTRVCIHVSAQSTLTTDCTHIFSTSKSMVLVPYSVSDAAPQNAIPRLERLLVQRLGHLIKDVDNVPNSRSFCGKHTFAFDDMDMLLGHDAHNVKKTKNLLHNFIIGADKGQCLTTHGSIVLLSVTERMESKFITYVEHASKFSCTLGDLRLFMETPRERK